ncbi:MAG TPA: hypothetical protein VF787_08835 [Thermoanaerobaculia bacterium]
MRRVIPAAMLILVLASCGGESEEVSEQKVPATPSAATPTATTAPVATTSAASQLTSVSEKGGTVTIVFTENGAEQELYGELRDNGKRKYTLDDGPVLYEVKPGDDQSFKLRNPDGSLRWKVKISPDKIKISDNEENKNAFELKPRAEQRVKVVAPGDRELGNVRFASEKIDVETADGKVIFSKRSAFAAGGYGVLLLDQIPPRERFIIVAELLSRGR